MTDPAACFEGWTCEALDDYPTICDGGPERVYIRAAEAHELLKRAYLAGWTQGRDLGSKIPEIRS